MSQWDVKAAEGPRGPGGWLEQREREDAVRSGVLRGQSNNEIARASGMASATALRIRRRLGLPNYYGKQQSPVSS